MPIHQRKYRKAPWSQPLNFTNQNLCCALLLEPRLNASPTLTNSTSNVNNKRKHVQSFLASSLCFLQLAYVTTCPTDLLRKRCLRCHAQRIIAHNCSEKESILNLALRVDVRWRTERLRHPSKSLSHHTYTYLSCTPGKRANKFRPRPKNQHTLQPKVLTRRCKHNTQGQTQRNNNVSDRRIATAIIPGWRSAVQDLQKKDANPSVTIIAKSSTRNSNSKKVTCGST